MPLSPHKIIRSSRKTFGLEITSNAELIIRVPRFALPKTIENIIQEKKDWIIRKQSQIQNRKSQLQTRKYKHGEKFLFLGKEYELQIIDNLKQVLHFQDKIKLSARYTQNAQKVLQVWYQREALKMFEKQVKYFAKEHKFQYKKIRISNAKKRWGSCSAQNNLSFSWKLIMAPQFVLDYVVVHELVHTEEKNHGEKFWEKVSDIFPQYQEAKLWLKEKGHILDFEF